MIDDDDAIRTLLSSALADTRCVVLAASDGCDTLALLRALGPRRQPDLILLEMPVLDGRDFATHYGALPGRRAPILVVSGAADAEQAAARLSAVELLPKPFDLDHLLARAHSHLREGATGGPGLAPRAA